MTALTARVKEGRLVLDEPTSLPDGTEVRMEPVDGDDLDDADRAALHRALDESLADEARGDVAPIAELIAELRIRP